MRKVLEWWPNGNPKFQGEVDGLGRKQGAWVGLYEDATISSVMEMRDDEPHGKMKTWHSNGNVWIEGYYEKGAPHGRWKTYYSNGNIEKDLVYEHGHVVAGSYSEWDQRGQLIQRK